MPNNLNKHSYMNIGIFGVGNFGETHIKVLQEIKHFNIVGFFDPNQTKSNKIENDFNIKQYQNASELIKQCDAVDIVSETSTHFELIKNSIKYNKHIFIEKPICSNEMEVSELSKITTNYNSIIQVGHIERYNPAVKEGFQGLSHIESITTTRTGYLDKRNQNVSIALDLMIHDIDLVLSIIKSPITSISAISKKPTHSQHNNIECILKFKNDSKAILRAERRSDIESQRSIKINCIDNLIEIDLLKRVTKTKNSIWQAEKNINPLKDEFMDFYSNITTNKRPLVSVEEACNAVKVALEIEKILNCQK